MKFIKVSNFLFLALVILIASSCSDYNKLVKSTNLDKKYEMAIKYYDKQDYLKAFTLFEELITLYRGTAKEESTLYYYANTNYNMGDYELAHYYYKNFVKTFPSSAHKEECAYMAAQCYYLSSPAFSLDQSDTKTAIKEFQGFIDEFPKSNRIPECNVVIDELRGKLERKYYEIAKQYYNTGDYKASVYSFNSMLKDFPNTKYQEELHYLIIKSNYLLALNSIESKKVERIKLTIDAYLKFVNAYPKSEYLGNAESIYESAMKLKEKFKNQTT